MFTRSLKRLKSWMQEGPRFGKMVLRYGWPRRAIIPAYGGLGDHLMLTTVTHEYYRRKQRGIWILSNYPDLFRHNPTANAIPDDAYSLWLVNRLSLPISSPFFSRLFMNEDYEVPPPDGRHILSCLCQTAGMHGSVALRPYLYLTRKEREIGRLFPRQAVIQSTNLGAKFPMTTKRWFPHRFQAVVNALRHKINFIQLGQTAEPPLDGATDLRGKTTLRQAAAILSQSQVFVGLIGFPMHLARAVDCRSVIIHGGRERPDQSGYVANENLFTELECSPCWRFNNCPHDMECMKRIEPGGVIAAVERQLLRFGEPLPVAHAEVPNEPLVLGSEPSRHQYVGSTC